MVPEPVAFRVGGEQGEEELQLVFQVLREEGGVGGGCVWIAGRGCWCWRWCWGEEGALQDLPAVVPDRVEFGVELEELGGEVEGVGGVVVCGPLRPATG